MSKEFQSILHPYLFVLQEGKKIQADLMDYSLLMLHVNCNEVMRSPKQHGISFSTPKQKTESLTTLCESEMNIPKSNLPAGS